MVSVNTSDGCFKLNWNDGWIGCPSYLWGQVCGACDVTTPNINASDPTFEPGWAPDVRFQEDNAFQIPHIPFLLKAIYRESFGPLVLKHSQSVSCWHHTFFDAAARPPTAHARSTVQLKAAFSCQRWPGKPSKQYADSTQSKCFQQHPPCGIPVSR